MLIYYTEVTIDEGFQILAEPKASRLVRGKRTSAPNGIKLYEALRSQNAPLKCWSCGIEATCFISNKGSNDKIGAPNLDLFAMTLGGPVLMTRDHIIPKSYGGVNDVENLRVGCSPCNNARGNELDATDLEFMRAHPELIGSQPKLTIAEGVTSVPKSCCDPHAASKEAKARARLEKNRAKRKRARDRKRTSALPPLTTMLPLALA